MATNFRRRAPNLAPDATNIRRMLAPPQRPSCDLATVGHTDSLTGLPETTPAWVRIEQGEFLVEVTTANGDELIARIGSDVDYLALSYGCQVVVVYPDGDETLATIVARLGDLKRPVPPVVAGVQTGAAAAVAKGLHVPAPAWTFTRLPDGQLMAIETGLGGDYLVHSGGSVEIKAAPTGAIHLNGRVALGEGPTSPPFGGTVSAAGTTIPGVPAVPAIDTPYTPAPAPPQTIVPFVGTEHAILRAKDDIQSSITIDPYFWAWVTAVGTNPMIAALAGAPPIALHSRVGGLNGPGCPHTAADQQPPA
ncbi:MAG: hypothetical protein M0R28_17750 [Pigmentiphaga sp.]|nr:hypothetical protein [Pigmentiphaga sp.]